MAIPSKIDFTLMKATPSAQILIAAAGDAAQKIDPLGVAGFITSELSFSVSANYGNPLESRGSETLTTLSQQIGALAGKVLPPGYIEQYQSATFRSVDTTVSTWASSTRPVFSVNLVFLAVKESDDVRKPVNQLYRTVMPSFQGVLFTDLMRSPMGYSPQGMKSTGTFLVRIGRWFKATQQVMTNVSFTFSKESIASGAPLYATGTITFEPYRMISAKELQEYIFSIGTGNDL